MRVRNLSVSNSIVSRSRCFCNFHNLFMRVSRGGGARQKTVCVCWLTVYMDAYSYANGLRLAESNLSAVNYDGLYVFVHELPLAMDKIFSRFICSLK